MKRAVLNRDIKLMAKRITPEFLWQNSNKDPINREDILDYNERSIASYKKVMAEHDHLKNDAFL